MTDKKSKPTVLEFDAWITKYALTSGVRKARVRLSSSVPGVVEVLEGPFTGGYVHGEDRDWHKDESKAVERVRVMIAAKRKALTKKLSELNGLEALLAGGKLPV